MIIITYIIIFTQFFSIGTSMFYVSQVSRKKFSDCYGLNCRDDHSTFTMPTHDQPRIQFSQYKSDPYILKYTQPTYRTPLDQLYPNIFPSYKQPTGFSLPPRYR